MRIYYFPQPSMRSYETGLWHLESSSMMARMRSVVYHMPGNWDWVWAVPQISQLSDSYREVVPVDADLLHLKWHKNVGYNRWEFPIEGTSEIFQKLPPDLCITETVEHACALRAVMDMAGTECPIISVIAYVPMHTKGFEAWPDPTIRQIEGYLHSDAVAFNSDVERIAWAEIAQEYVKDGTLPTKNKQFVWNGLFEPDDSLAFKDEGRELKPEGGIPTLFYTGRLSDPDRTHFPELAGALENLATKRDFRVWVGNPNEAMDWKSIQSIFPNYEEHPFGERLLTRQEYLKLLWASDVVPILIPNRTSSFCEAVYTENIVLGADMIGEFSEDVIEISDMSSDALSDYLSESFDAAEETNTKRYRRQQRWVAKQHAVHKNIEPFRETIEAAL